MMPKDDLVSTVASGFRRISWNLLKTLLLTASEAPAFSTGGSGADKNHKAA